jgi:hypothetical protein
MDALWFMVHVTPCRANARAFRCSDVAITSPAAVSRERVPVSQVRLQLSRGPAALATRQALPGSSLTLRPSWCLQCQAPTNFVLAGRATSLPFTTVLTGPQRTTTDNAMLVLTCSGSERRRWQDRPIWLCKQEVRSICRRRPEPPMVRAGSA